MSPRLEIILSLWLTHFLVILCGGSSEARVWSLPPDVRAGLQPAPTQQGLPRLHRPLPPHVGRLVLHPYRSVDFIRNMFPQLTAALQAWCLHSV